MNSDYDTLPIIFLDIDGVLNDEETPNKSYAGFIGVEDMYLERLYEIIMCTGAEIILVSDWKSEWDKNWEKCGPDGMYLNNRFKEHEIWISDKTDDRSIGTDAESGRGLGIKKYLKDHPTDKYVILDDCIFDDYDDELKKHLVFVRHGLNIHDVEKAVQML